MNVNGLSVLQFQRENLNLKNESVSDKFSVTSTAETTKQNKNESFSSTLSTVQQSKKPEVKVSNDKGELKDTKAVEDLKKEVKNDGNKIAGEIKTIKDKLKAAGVSKEELDKIDDVDQLKSLVLEKVKDGTIKDTDLVNQIFSMLATLSQSINLLSEKVNSLIKQVVGDELKDLKSENQVTEKGQDVRAAKVVALIEKLVTKEINRDDKLVVVDVKMDDATRKILVNSLDKGFAAEVENMLKENSGDKISVDFLSKIEEALKKGVSNNFKEKTLEVVKPKIEGINQELTAKTPGKTFDKTEVVVETQNKNLEENNLASSGDGKDEKFLKLLAGEDKGDKLDKISRVTTFMNHITTANVSNNEIEPESITINKATINQDVVKAVKFMNINGLKELTVKINPRELGELVIKVTMQSGAMKASITAANKDAFNLLNANIQDITNKFEQNSNKIESLSLNVYNEDTTFFKNGSQGEETREQNKGRETTKLTGLEDLKQEEIDNLSRNDSNVNILA